MTINYDTLTVEGLEEHVEHVDWSLVPSHLFTEDVKKSFGFMHKLQVRIWIEDLLSQMVIKEDQEKYPKQLFFFKDEEWHMHLNLKNGSLWCKYSTTLYILETKFYLQHFEGKKILKNTINSHFKDKKIIPTCHTWELPLSEDEVCYLIEDFFKSKEITIIDKDKIPPSLKAMEDYFKNK